MTTAAELRRKLDDKEYRDEFVAAHIHTGLAFQIRALREQRGWSQLELGRRIGQPQSGVSRLEIPGHGFSLATLKRLAVAFDVALVVRFVPFSELAEWVANIGPDSLRVASFAEDQGFLEHHAETRPIPVATGMEVLVTELLEPVFRTEVRHVSPQGALLRATMPRAVWVGPGVGTSIEGEANA